MYNFYKKQVIFTSQFSSKAKTRKSYSYIFLVVVSIVSNSFANRSHQPFDRSSVDRSSRRSTQPSIVAIVHDQLVTSFIPLRSPSLSPL